MKDYQLIYVMGFVVFAAAMFVLAVTVLLW